VEERQVLAAAGERALRRLGFAVRRSEGRRTTALWAETETRVIAVACRDGGVMDLDVAGCQGNGCDEPVAALNQAFAGEGIHLEMRRRTDHGDDRGGTLIRRSSASPEGIVAAIEEEAPVSCNRLQPAAVSRPRVGLGGGRR
jgi:hypothetical protein